MTSPITPGADPWVIQVNERTRYQQQFDSLKPVNGVITGVQAKDFLLQSQLSPSVLGQIWGLSDTDSDGKMNINEFSIACKLINLKLRGYEVPCSLPPSLIRSLQSFATVNQGIVTSSAQVSATISPIPNAVPRPVASPPTCIPKIGPPIIPPISMPVGAGFVSTTGPPPKPQPPSFPNSPVAIGSPVKPIVPVAAPPVQMVQPMTAASPSNTDLFHLLMSQDISSIASIAPVVPINTGPVPTAAFSMSQGEPFQTVATGAIPPLPNNVISVSSLGSVATGNGMIGVTGIPQTVTQPVTSMHQNNVSANGSIIHTPVSTNTPLSTTARPPSIDRIGSIDSQHSQHSVTSPQAIEWAVPHQTKLKYTQLFNISDKSRSNFLSGPQARNIMVQSQLPQAVLARIWALSDMDSDGRLGCEEFVLAMHLCDIAKAGEIIPTTLPPELIPPTFRRQRQSSLSSQGIPDNVDPLAGMPQTSFEDKRKENFDKGQAELERRRKALLEVQRKEQEERERKEREEAEKREKIRLEQERRRQAELEQQMLRQKEIEEEKEEQRKRAQEQREAARKEMERQRQLEWEKQKSQELQAQRQKEQDILLKLKAKNQSLTIELGLLNDKVKELSQKICDTRVGVSTVKTTIDGMRTTRDQQLQEMSTLKNKLRDQNQRLLVCSQEKAKIDAKTKANTTQDSTGQEEQKLAFANKQIALKQMKDKIADLEQEIKEKEKEVENSNSQLEELQTQMKTMLINCQELNEKFEEKKAKVLEMRKNANEAAFSNSAWGDDAWGTSSTNEVDVDTWPTDNTVTTASTSNEESSSPIKKYRALYEFVARNQDEISFQPGDIIIVPPVQNAEPGWMAGEIRGHTGWFPESYVEPIDVSANTKLSNDAFIHQDSVEKRMLEEIAEVPENVSDAGSAVGEAPYVEPITPKLGEGQLCNTLAITLYQYRPIIEQHLSFSKGETVTIKEEQSVWCYGESSTGKTGWFPKSYIKMETVNGQNGRTPSTNCVNEYYISLYQYASNEAGDLNFSQGEVIEVTKKDGDWWTGVIGTKTGIFPSNYVEKYNTADQVVQKAAVQDTLTNENEQERRNDVTQFEIKSQDKLLEKTAEELEEERAEAEDRAELPDFAAMSAQQYTKRGRKPEIVQVIAPYKSTSVEQLDLQKGQLIMIRKKTETGWWEGELQARGKKRQIGWFPASYVKLLTSNSNRSTPVSHRYQDSPTTDPFAEKVMALYPYKAQHEDEISFEKGDVIVVLSKDEDAWWRGELNGMTGAFPSNYVSPMFSDFVKEDPMAQLDTMERKRQEYIKELIITEEAYIVDMQLVHEVFEKPLLSSMILSADEVDKIFVNWRDIIACNDNFLRTLRIRRDNSKGGIIRMIGDILCESIPRMSAYVRFCSCQISAAVYLQQLTETLPAFVEVSQRCQQDPRTKGMPLSSFLIKPMQRITKYPLLIGKILEYTRAEHPDKQYLQEALAKAEEFCTQVNEGVREKENSDRLEWLQTHVACDGLDEQIVFNSLTNSLGPRKLVHYGILHKAKSGKELIGFLTNDFLLFSQPLKSMPSGQQFSFERNEHQKFKLYRRPIFLQDLILFNESEPHGGSAMAGTNGSDAPDQSKTLKLSDSKKAMTLVAPSPSECSLWVRRIAEARRQFAENEKCRLQRQRSKQAQFKACGRILVTVVEGSNLRITTGKCNAFCKVSMGSQEEQTIVVSSTDCPVWDTSMQFQVKDLHDDTLCITIFDKGYFSPDEFLGRAEVRVVDIVRDSKDICGPITKRIKLKEVDKGDVVLKLDLRLFGNR